MRKQKKWGEILATSPESPMGPYLQAWLPWRRVILGVSKDPVADYT